MPEVTTLKELMKALAVICDPELMEAECNRQFANKPETDSPELDEMMEKALVVGFLAGSSHVHKFIIDRID